MRGGENSCHKGNRCAGQLSIKMIYLTETRALLGQGSPSLDSLTNAFARFLQNYIITESKRRADKCYT